MERTQFTQLPISDETRRAITEMGFEEPTSIQAQSIPLILEGSDIIGHSQTGTGKTAAFGIPIIERIKKELKGLTQALVLCPTRELAIQGCEEMRKFAKYKHSIRIVPIYGGQPIDKQINTLKGGAEIVIGTPGRVMDHLRRHTLKFKDLSMVVLDEADEMLNMGFREDIEIILKDIPEKRQTILFSATMPPEILRITKQYQTNPRTIKTVHHELTVPGVKQYGYEVPSDRKVDALARLLDYYDPNRSLIFCNTKQMVDDLVNELQLRGYSPDGLHGDMKQQTRTTVMNSFKNGATDILIATDVAARGIDVDDIDAVFNFDLPQDEEYYVHRIGRTGRAGKTGNSFTLVSGRRQIYALRDIERYTKSKIELKQLPSMDEVQEIKNDKLFEKIIGVLQSNNYNKYELIVDRLMESNYTSVDIACAALHILSENPNESAAAGDEIDKFIANAATKSEMYDKNRGKNKLSVKTRQLKKSERDKEPMTRLSINVGKKDKITANHIVAAVAGKSGLPGSIIGSIRVYDKYTFVEVPKRHSDLVSKTMKGCIINGKASSTEIVKDKKRVQ